MLLINSLGELLKKTLHGNSAEFLFKKLHKTMEETKNRAFVIGIIIVAAIVVSINLIIAFF